MCKDNKYERRLNRRELRLNAEKKRLTLFCALGFVLFSVLVLLTFDNLSFGTVILGSICVPLFLVWRRKVELCDKILADKQSGKDAKELWEEYRKTDLSDYIFSKIAYIFILIMGGFGYLLCFYQVQEAFNIPFSVHSLLFYYILAFTYFLFYAKLLSKWIKKIKKKRSALFFENHKLSKEHLECFKNAREHKEEA